MSIATEVRVGASDPSPFEDEIQLLRESFRADNELSKVLLPDEQSLTADVGDESLAKACRMGVLAERARRAAKNQMPHGKYMRLVLALGDHVVQAQPKQTATGWITEEHRYQVNEDLAGLPVLGHELSRGDFPVKQDHEPLAYLGLGGISTRLYVGFGEQSLTGLANRLSIVDSPTSHDPTVQLSQLTNWTSLQPKPLPIISGLR